MAIKSFFFVFFLLLMCLQMDLYSALTVKINPVTFNKASASTVDVTCELDKSEIDAKEILLMKIARKGERAIVLLHRNNSLSYSSGNKEEFPAKGDVTDNVIDTSLRMSITTPDPEDSGAYTCSVYYIDNQGSLKEHRASGYLTVEDPAFQLLNTTLQKLQDQVEKGNKEIDSLKWADTMDKVKLADFDSRIDKHSDDIQAILNKDNDVDNKLKKVEDKTKDEIKKMADAINKKAAADKTKMTNMQSTVLHQAETIRDLTEKLSEFEKTIQSLTAEVKKKEDKKTGADGTKGDLRSLKETVQLLTKMVNDVTDKANDNEELAKKMTAAANVMAQKIDANTKKATGLELEVTVLEDEIKKKLKELTSDGLDNDFLNLQDKVKEHTRQIRDVTETANDAEKMGEKLKAVTEILAKQINDDKKDDDSSSSKDQVAFHATSGVYGLFPKENESISFYDVTLNEGKGYDKTTGVFTAPIAGIYAFQMYLQIPCYGCKIEVTIEVDNKILTRFSGGTPYTRDQHSVNAVAKLRTKSMVKAVVTFIKPTKDNPKWSLGYLRKCAFNGFLVAAD